MEVLDADAELTQILHRMISGMPGATDSALEAIYPRLRRLAQTLLIAEQNARTYQPTALVNELYLRHLRRLTLPPKDRQHFFRLAARGMRQILVDHARARLAQKRDAAQFVPLQLATGVSSLSAEMTLTLNHALEELAGFDELAARVIELRFFLGCTLEETAEVLDVSIRTVRDNWDYARAWLEELLNSGAS